MPCCESVEKLVLVKGVDHFHGIVCKWSSV